MQENLSEFYSWIDKSIEIGSIIQKCLLVIYGKNKRSNVEQTEDGLKRKKTEYSSKKHNLHN